MVLLLMTKTSQVVVPRVACLLYYSLTFKLTLQALHVLSSPCYCKVFKDLTLVHFKLALSHYKLALFYFKLALFQFKMDLFYFKLALFQFKLAPCHPAINKRRL